MPGLKKKGKTTPSPLKILLLIVLLVIGVVAAIMAVQQSQENRSDARMVNDGDGSTATPLNESVGDKKSTLPIIANKKPDTSETRSGSRGGNTQQSKECLPECELDSECSKGFRCAGTGHCNRWCERIPAPKLTERTECDTDIGSLCQDAGQTCVPDSNGGHCGANIIKDKHDLGGDCNFDTDCKSNKCRRSLQQDGTVHSNCVPSNWVEPAPFCAVASKCPGGECVQTPQGGFCQRDGAHVNLDAIVGKGCKTGADCPLNGICNISDGVGTGVCAPRQQDRLEDGSDCTGRDGHPMNVYCKSGICSWDNLIQTDRCVQMPTGGSIPSPLKVVGKIVQQVAGAVGNVIKDIRNAFPTSNVLETPKEIQPSI